MRAARRLVVGALCVALVSWGRLAAADPPAAMSRVPRVFLMWSAGGGAGQEEIPVHARVEPQFFDAHLRDWQCGFQWSAQSDGPGMMQVSCAPRQGPAGAMVTLSHQCTDGTQGFEGPSLLTVRDSAAAGGTSATLIARCDAAAPGGAGAP